MGLEFQHCHGCSDVDFHRWKRTGIKFTFCWGSNEQTPESNRLVMTHTMAACSVCVKISALRVIKLCLLGTYSILQSYSLQLAPSEEQGRFSMQINTTDHPYMLTKRNTHFICYISSWYMGWTFPIRIHPTAALLVTAALLRQLREHPAAAGLPTNNNNTSKMLFCTFKTKDSAHSK